ncbi:MAG: hypothetical protein ACR2FJ_02855 [Qipengyuania sp.]
MFQLTKEKVIKKIDRLMEELATIEKRIKDHEENAELAVKLGIARPSDDYAIREWRAAHDETEANLRDAKTSLQYGKEDFREINRVLPMVKQSFNDFRRVLDDTDRLEAAGRAAAQARFGKRS